MARDEKPGNHLIKGGHRRLTRDDRRRIKAADRERHPGWRLR
jgi:hypothetical protein